MTASKIRRPYLLFLLGYFVLTMSVSNLGAQISVSNTSLSGFISDSSGAAVPEATITLSSAAQGITRTFTSLPDGRYTFAAVPVGTYSLKVEKPGFSTYQQSGIVLEVGQPSTQGRPSASWRRDSVNNGDNFGGDTANLERQRKHRSLLPADHRASAQLAQCALPDVHELDGQQQRAMASAKRR